MRTSSSHAAPNAQPWWHRHAARAAVVLGLLCLMWLGVVGLVVFAKAWDNRAQQQLAEQQTVQTDLWARSLQVRVEAQQRWLYALSHSALSSLPTETPALREVGAAQFIGGPYALESLYLALPSGQLTVHGAVAQAADEALAVRDALHRTLSEGKPLVRVVRSALQETAGQVPMLYTVPLHRTGGGIAGALALRTTLPLAALLPDVEPETGPMPAPAYWLFDAEGQVLAQSAGPPLDPAVQQALEVLQADMGGRLVPVAPKTRAETQSGGHSLVSSVHIPLPQWQAVVVRRRMPEHLQALTPYAMTVMTWAVALSALASLWLLAGGAKKRASISSAPSESPAALGPAVADPAQEAEQYPLGDRTQDRYRSTRLRGFPLAQVPAWLDMLPCPLWIEVEGQVQALSPQLGAVLGYFEKDLPALVLDQLFVCPQSLVRVQQVMAQLAVFEGVLQLRKKDGGSVAVQVWVSALVQSPEVRVWRLALLWRPAEALPLHESRDGWCDALTGLPHSEAFAWGLQAWMSYSMHVQSHPLAQRPSDVPAQGCLLFVDVDHLGAANECSREWGDQILRYLARVLVDYTQPLGHPARLGGDEFAVMLPGVSLAHAQCLGQALCDALWNWQPLWQAERQWVSMSVGVVAVDALRHTAQQALHAADMACYEAKRRGRNQVVPGHIYTPAPHAKIQVQP